MRPEQEVKTSGWWEAFIRPKFTLSNYKAVLSSSPGSANLTQFFFNSLKITIPAVIMSVGIAAMAAYAFSWMKFKGRDWLFVAVVAMLVVPLQMALIPLLRADHRRCPHRQRHDLPVPPPQQQRRPRCWVAHVCFGLPFCIFILKNFISALPREIIEAARVDGAGHLTVFTRLVMPLSVPALASLAIFQFMWIWNDLLIGLVYGGVKNKPIIAKLVEVGGTLRSVVAPAHRPPRSCRWWCPCWCSSRSSGTSSAACWPGPSRDDGRRLARGAGRTTHARRSRSRCSRASTSGTPPASIAWASQRCGSATARSGRGARASTGRHRSTCPAAPRSPRRGNPDLVERIGQVLGRETKAKGAGVLLAPTVNLHRTPTGGRNFECMSEDPYLTSRIAVAYVQGLQSEGVAACVKHFVGNDTEFERMSIDSQIDERTLRELYLVPFEAVVKEAGVLAVMTAYNRINGPFAADSEPLVRGVLRGEWGFDGLVMSDWFGLHSTVEALAAGARPRDAGPDAMPWPGVARRCRARRRHLRAGSRRGAECAHPDGSGGRAGDRRPGPELTRDDPDDRALIRLAGADGHGAAAQRAGRVGAADVAARGGRTAAGRRDRSERGGRPESWAGAAPTSHRRT